ncbi:wall-associated receptor kinase 5 isoform X2 [Cryptomeria japonica]|uniref:wall-associated receptor kinase 5 isoform X2 n=1 Tax=Cryptomeria japonica TaxID=3369 RepID=UPI0027DA7223|nr:wall-associated receptor kinase 5 isoform X2 [Cryptomeria japonica]
MSILSRINLFQWIVFIWYFIEIYILKADGCFDKCGEMDIPYPFSIAGNGNSNCGLPGFEINCTHNHSSGSTQPIPFLSIPSGQVQILKFSHDHLYINATQFFASTSNCLGHRNKTNITFSSKAPFWLSTQNKFVAIGCEAVGFFGIVEDNIFTNSGGCASLCTNPPTYSNCNGDGCCQTSVPSNYTDYVIGVFDFSWLHNKSKTSCNYAGILDENSWDLISKSDTLSLNFAYVSLNWSIANDTCATARAKGSYQCAPEAECNDIGRGYQCNCKPGFFGDGYLNGSRCTEGGRCENTNGSYKCSCAKGHGDGTEDGTRCSMGKFQPLPVAIGVCVTLVAMLIGGGIVLLILRCRRAKLVKQNNFHRNGGNLLQKLILSQVDGMRIFSLDEVEKATDNFSPSLIMGSGGYGKVYKGTLSNGILVAIKMANSKQIDSKEINDFINEIVILNQINHKNVVKLLGCCLESPVPLLIYEYISNGNLFDHLQGNKYEQHLHWNSRLRIATESAEALSFLHSAASMPIVHRDVKSSNILLDDVYTPKIADFGLSRLVPMDQTHITTHVQGTMGYLDPEYIQTVQLTEKSDVYSFGVVLVELLTGLKPLSFERTKHQSNLAIYFLNTMKTKDLTEILDSRFTLEEARNMESMEKLANLAMKCLSVEGETRPTMKEVVEELVWIREGARPHVLLNSYAAQNDEEFVSLILNGEVIDEQTIEMPNLCTHSEPLSLDIQRFRFCL